VIYVGIVGAESAKFTPSRELKAKSMIERLLEPQGTILVSGGCHLGGIDIWAEEIADALGRSKVIHYPTVLEWARGYKPRNIKIAETSEVVHNITVASYPPDFDGMKFEACYHCISKSHVKSGGCWTAKYARTLGKTVYWHIIA